MNNVHVLDHPLIQHKLTYIRDRNTGNKVFRELVEEVSTLMAYEATRDLPLADTIVETPIGPACTKIIAGKKLGVVPILRAGLGMVEGVLKIVPHARVGHLGMYRDEETLQPVPYYTNLPADAAERDFIVLDPMLATGGSAIAAIHSLRQKGARSVKLMCLLAAPEGIAAVTEAFPDVAVYVAEIDERLNEHGYIVPGLGDAGDRLYGTK